MSKERDSTTTPFQKLQSQIADIGLEFHRETLLANAQRNAVHVRQTIRDIQRDPRPCLVINPGPSLYSESILKRLDGFAGTVVCSDGAYIQCLKNGIRPDYVVSLDPSPRVARWFGERVADSYFQRQDLDVTIREEQENVELVHANKVPLVISNCASQEVVKCTQDFQCFWFAPLVDDPQKEASLTKELCQISRLPAINTGGTVGTTAVLFALLQLHCSDAAVVGMDFAYRDGTPLEQTQEYELLRHHQNIYDYYPYVNGYWGACFTSPTYSWYMKNFLDLLSANDLKVTNCSGGGALMGENIECCEIEDWINAKQ